MIIAKVCRMVSFNQSPWLEKYIDYNAKKRAEADTDFKNDYHRGLSNSFFGKTIEDVRKRIGKDFVKNADEKLF